MYSKTDENGGDRLELFVDNYCGTPIYQQLVDQLRGQILSGTLAGDTPLPSIRGLAKDLRVSVITTKRAYEELERAGLVYTVPGKGCFVAQGNQAALRAAQMGQVEERLRAAWFLARSSGVDRETFLEICTLVTEETT